jgi:hypothetical protein
MAGQPSWSTSGTATGSKTRPRMRELRGTCIITCTEETGVPIGRRTAAPPQLHEREQAVFSGAPRLLRGSVIGELVSGQVVAMCHDASPLRPHPPGR